MIFATGLFTNFLNVVWFCVSVLMILVVLVQKGKGGGLAGALGGAGGSSAFGSRAGDVFTRITVVVFCVWLLLALVLVPRMAKETIYQDSGVSEVFDAELNAEEGLLDADGGGIAIPPASESVDGETPTGPAAKEASPPSDAADKADNPAPSSKASDPGEN